jgi:hypothetical protein
MNFQIQKINEILQKLPPEALNEIAHYIEFISKKFPSKTENQFIDLSRLKDLKEQNTLQKEN